ncbi:Chloramphenicol acetyltransferase-like domain-containing protein [Artemisia annua]|uniref:Chloramphenicol acetyltransferase-like domain-containing protein n=1 Tax=Artemisia annua TaxID=35608 RepID=A0A2U1KWM7_ARTAN|nr:Chloramphenicol acetyltransferase-like domain-containing protein [Artemisia annua]
MPCQSSQCHVEIIEKTTIFPVKKSTLPNLKLSVSDLPMLSCHYIQKGNLFTKPPATTISILDLVSKLKSALAKTLVHFPPLGGRLVTDDKGYVYITCNDAGVEFVHANSSTYNLSVSDVLAPTHVPDCVKSFFAFDRMVSYAGHKNALLGVQVTELSDGVFIGFSVNHAVVDGTSLWNFINMYSEICRGEGIVSSQDEACFVRDSVLISEAVLKVPEDGLKVSFDEHVPLSERVFRFSRDSILKLKNRTNNSLYGDGEINVVELIGKEISSFQSLSALLWRAVTRARKFPDSKMTTFRMAVNCRHRLNGTSLWNFINMYSEICRGEGIVSSQEACFVRDSVLISEAVLKVPEDGLKVSFDEHVPLSERVFRFSRDSILKLKNRTNNNVVELIGKEISSFQSLSALLWRAVTRARKFPDSKMTTFRMAVNCRHRLSPKLDKHYFGNAIQSIPTYATSGDVLSHDLKWCAEQLNKNVLSHDDTMVGHFVKNWENDPRCFPLGNFDGAMLTMGSSPRFPMFDNDFGWGKPIAIRSGRANKFDGKISAFPGREGGGSVDLEVVLSPETMAGIESDPEFMEYVTSDC